MKITEFLIEIICLSSLYGYCTFRQLLFLLQYLQVSFFNFVKKVLLQIFIICCAMYIFLSYLGIGSYRAKRKPKSVFWTPI